MASSTTLDDFLAQRTRKPTEVTRWFQARPDLIKAISNSLNGPTAAPIAAVIAYLRDHADCKFSDTTLRRYLAGLIQ